MYAWDRSIYRQYRKEDEESSNFLSLIILRVKWLWISTFFDSEVVSEQIMSHSFGSVSDIHLSILISLLSIGLSLESQCWICEWIHVFKSCNELASTAVSVSDGWGSGIEGLVFLCFHSAWANGIVRSEFDLYINVPNLCVVQVHEIWCCRLVVKLLSIHLALITWFTSPISLVVI